MKRGIVLFNLGGPWTLKDVKPFLYNLFSDPAILVGIPAPFRQAVALFISQVKGPSSIRTYDAIGGGSPQLLWTRIQADGLNRLANAKGWETSVMIGMRASQPSIEMALQELKNWGADEVVLFPLFPQFSTTTTGTCFQEAKRVLRKLKWKPALVEIEKWPDHSGYTTLLKKTLEETLQKAEAEPLAQDKGPLHVVFSAHSLPVAIVRRGDPYPDDVDRTVRVLTRDLRYPWSLAFQSRNGKMPWLNPYLEDELRRLGQNGIRRVIVVPISFVSDHIETLWELDQLYAEVAKKSGIESYHRSRAFNGDPEFHQVLYSVLREHVV